MAVGGMGSRWTYGRLGIDEKKQKLLQQQQQHVFMCLSVITCMEKVAITFERCDSCICWMAERTLSSVKQGYHEQQGAKWRSSRSGSCKSITRLL